MSDHETAGWWARLRGRLTHSQATLVDKAAAASAPGSAGLHDIEHVVILMQENRSFDHYFGTMSAVRGFSDPHVLTREVGGVRHTVFDQFGYKPGSGPDPSGYLQPFRLVSDPPLKDGQATNDISHEWTTQHRSWSDGRMDGFLTSHLAGDGTTNGPLTMGYLTREDLPLYYALADAFTVCDGFFCSVLGPTDPNRVMAVSGTIDPEGKAGGPILKTYYDRPAEYGKLHWETMPERLQAAGVSWKIYNHPLAELAFSPMPFFRAFTDPFSVTGFELTRRALAPMWPDEFHHDVREGELPAVSWLIPPLAQSEHPATPPRWGEHYIQEVLEALVSNPDVWARTVLFIVHDENGGFFDHVPPVTAPEGTPGEWLAAPLSADAGGIAGPVGLGFRIPALVVSPFSRGGYLCSDAFDHTSVLRFIETRFGVEVPNLSAWRRSVTGDLTSALALSRPPDTSLPRLPEPSVLGDLKVAEQAVLNALAGTFDVGIPFPVPAANHMPAQESGPARPPVPR